MPIFLFLQSHKVENPRITESLKSFSRVPRITESLKSFSRVFSADHSKTMHDINVPVMATVSSIAPIATDANIAD